MNAESLFYAVKSGDLAEVQSILKHNSDIEVDALYEGGFTPLLKAIMEKHKPIIELLLAHGAAVNGPVGAWRTPLQMASSRTADIVSLLLEHGADVDGFSVHHRMTPLTCTCNANTRADIAQLLLNAGANVNGGVGDVAPLHIAALDETTEPLDLLIQSGADVNILSNKDHADMPAGSTSLHYAAVRDSLDCIKSLLAAGADPNIADSAGQTPLHRAACSSAVDAVNALLDAGSDPLHQDDDGRTPLQYFYEEVDEEEPFSARELNVITALVAAGDRSWECVPTPCPGLEAAMLSVWQAAPDELPELVKRMENPPQTLIELFPRLDADDVMKKVVQEVLRVVHHHFYGFPEVMEHLLKDIFGLGTG